MWLSTNVPVEWVFFQEVGVNQRVMIRLKHDPLIYRGRLVRKGEYNGLKISLDSGGEISVTTLEIEHARILPESDQLLLFAYYAEQFFYV